MVNAPSVSLVCCVGFALLACRPADRGAGGIPRIARGSGGAAARDVPTDPAGRICAEAPEIALGGTVRGTTVAGADRFHASCGFGAASGDAVYRFRLARATHVVAALSGGHDTVLSLRGACGDETTELDCNDDEARGTNSRIEADLPAGEYTLVADGFGTGSHGAFALSLRGDAIDRAPAVAPLIRRVAEGEGAEVGPGTGAGPLRGTARFAKRSFTERGLSRAVRWMAVPRARVEAVGEGGAVVAQGETDDEGGFSLEIPSGSRVRVRLISRTTLLGADLRVVSDPGTERTWDLTTSAFVARGGETVTFRADVGGAEPAGAFNILANFVRYLPHVHRALEGRVPPPLYAFWRRGNNDALPQGSITAFLGEYGRHPGAYAMQIQGGDPGAEDSSDADQFDDPVVLHEFSHYIVGTMAGRFSLGGNHPSSALFFPGLAMDEGFANALACTVAGSSRYWDTAGLEPEEPLAQAHGRVLIDEDLERLRADLRGIGSQDVAQSLLWDLIDGADGLPDADNDGVAIGLTNALRVYRSFREGVAPPSMNVWLERAVSLGVVTDAQARSIVRSPERLGFAFPVPQGERWPEPIGVGETRRGRIDGRTQPAPSGGRNQQSNGLDASRAYTFHLASRARVVVELTIDGPGTTESHTDLDLQLATRELSSLAQSAGVTSTERVERELEPGDYVILVRDGDMARDARAARAPIGNRATYSLHVR
jgi:hypothetical protein